MEKAIMNKSPAFIWDMDGTLVDSYRVIVPGLQRVCRELGAEIAEEEILREVITHSVQAFILSAEQRFGIDPDMLRARFSELNEGLTAAPPTPHVSEALACLRAVGIPSYVFTHRGASAEAILKSAGLSGFFDEILTAKDGFARKPDPAAILYLVEKHDLDKSRCFYVGDRALDVECANRAGIRSILYLPEGSPARATGQETYIIKALTEIPEIAARLLPFSSGQR